MDLLRVTPTTQDELLNTDIMRGELLAEIAGLRREIATQAETIRNWTFGWQFRHERDEEVNRELNRLRHAAQSP